MAGERKNTRTRKVTVRFALDEYGRIEASFKRTTKRKLSEYIRAVVLHKPITTYTRNQSLEELIQVLLQLKKELSAIGNNYNQAVHKLHMLTRSTEAIQWTQQTESYHRLFIQQQAEISRQISQLSDQWLHG